jgi:hypothetical protein
MNKEENSQRELKHKGCNDVCFLPKTVRMRRAGDYDGGCHWNRFHCRIEEGEFVWLRQHGGIKATGSECEYWGMSQEKLGQAYTI